MNCAINIVKYTASIITIIAISAIFAIATVFQPWELGL